jgi:hypothetical protein
MSKKLKPWSEDAYATRAFLHPMISLDVLDPVYWFEPSVIACAKKITSASTGPLV